MWCLCTLQTERINDVQIEEMLTFYYKGRNWQSDSFGWEMGSINMCIDPDWIGNDIMLVYDTQNEEI